MRKLCNESVIKFGTVSEPKEKQTSHLTFYRFYVVYGARSTASHACSWFYEVRQPAAPALVEQGEETAMEPFQALLLVFTWSEAWKVSRALQTPAATSFCFMSLCASHLKAGQFV